MDHPLKHVAIVTHPKLTGAVPMADSAAPQFEEHGMQPTVGFL